MLTYVQIKTGRRVPSLGRDARVFVKGDRLTVWDSEGGRSEFALAEWREEHIPDLSGYFRVSEYREFVARYGVVCAKEQLRVDAPLERAQEHALLMDPLGPSDEQRLWFLVNFAANLNDFRDAKAAAGGCFTFDVGRFEAYLADRWGYSRVEGRLFDFLRERFGEFATQRIRRDFIGDKFRAAA